MLTNEEKLALLAKETTDRRWPPRRPVDAATLIVLDREGPKPKVLMGRRHPNLKFMPNVFVFPGGRAEKSDAAIPVGTELRLPVVEKLVARTLRGNAARARRLALASIRETFEETGLVIGKPGTPPKTAPASGPWAEFLATGHLPDLAAIHYLGRAITPPNRPKRFDTRFFVVDASAVQHTVENVVGPESELIELAWLTLAETISMPLPSITRIMLSELHSAVEEKTLGTSAPLPFFHERHKQRIRDLIV